ncbi:MAG: EF-hand domain-containing protein [Alphaproteobacteria bacterium]|nr:EF-hand domain-containing protein [Alphaproteobacteria bacterium]
MRLLDRKARWTQIFKMYDLDGNGYLSEADILIAYQRFLELKGIPETSEIGQAIIGGMRKAFSEDVMRSDLNGDGKVTIDEWHTHYGELLIDAGGGALLPSVELLQGGRNGFAAYDVDSDGRISIGDYLACAKIFAPNVSEDDLVAHWAVLTHENGTEGTLDFDQFMVFFLMVWCSSLDLPYWFPVD